ncbi:MAG: hypothetical protein AAF993_08790 [Pseudomonadota bacterium]
MELLPELAVRRSYLEQAQLHQTHRWIVASLTQPSQELITQLLAEDAELLINGRTETEGAGVLTFVSDLFVDQLLPSVETKSLFIEGACAVQSNQLAPCTIELKFRDADADFPLITAVHVTTQTGADITTDLTLNTIMRSRVLALKHRWHALVENPVKRAGPFREIIADGFTMDWERGSLSGFDALVDWVESTKAIAAARHDIAAFDCSQADALDNEQHYNAQFEFAWSGISQEGQPMQAESQHRWLVVDDPSARFARIKRMDVHFKVPFHIVENTTGTSPE